MFTQLLSHRICNWILSNSKLIAFLNVKVASTQYHSCDKLNVWNVFIENKNFFQFFLSCKNFVIVVMGRNLYRLLLRQQKKHPKDKFTVCSNKNKNKIEIFSMAILHISVVITLIKVYLRKQISHLPEKHRCWWKITSGHCIMGTSIYNITSAFFKEKINIYNTHSESSLEESFPTYKLHCDVAKKILLI